MEVSFLEIYNETIRDLLNGTDNVAKESDSGKHEIRLVGPNTNEVYVTDLTTHVVTCEEEVFYYSCLFLTQFLTKIFK